jgi:hypothetical protein
MSGGDTLWIHGGTYVGDFNCCGGGSTSPPQGSADQPTRVLGWPGDTVVLQGTTSQTLANHLTPTWGQNNLATITFKCGNGGSDCTGSDPHTRYLEVGNLTVRSGNAGAIALARAEHVYLHDLIFDNQSLYLGGAGPPDETTGLIWVSFGFNIFAENLVVNSSADPTPGKRRPVILFNCGNCAEGKFRLIDMADVEQGNLEAKHGNRSLTWEFVRLRNWTPWRRDDGGLLDIYNSSVITMRFISVAEAPSPLGPIWGYMSARRSNCANAAAPNSLYVTNMYSEEDTHGPDTYGIVSLDGFSAGGCQINDVRYYNSVAERFTIALNARAGPNGGASCNMYDWDFNAFVDVTEPLRYMASGCTVGIGSRSLVLASVPEVDHQPQGGSPVIDAGSDTRFGSTPWFPAPVGGGGRIDIGAYEHGGGSWPYDFQVVASVGKNPVTQSIRICWATAVQGCDVLIPLWDPWAQEPAARRSTPDWYQVQIDPVNHFRSGNGGVAKGFGSFYDSGPTNSANRYHDVPANSLTGAPQYYVQVRVAENNTHWSGGSDSLGSNGGWGPWSVAFYRFAMLSAGLQPPKNLRVKD